VRGPRGGVETLERLRRERLVMILGALFVVLMLSSIGIYTLEHRTPNGDIKGLGDALWWSLVTVTTVGYGDKVPHTPWGRLLAMATMLCGVSLLSITTATIASVFVEKKIREEKGLETIKLKGHVVLCGWNEFGDEIIEGLIQYSGGRRLKIVLVNDLPPESIDELRLKYEGTVDIEYVRGNHVYENVLRNANVPAAEVVIVIADISGDKLLENADQRTILSTLAIKSLAPTTRTCAELLDESNRAHLQRVNVDEVIVRGGRTGILIAGTALSPGLPAVLEGIMALDAENHLWRMKIPEGFVGENIGAFQQYLRQRHQALLLAIMREQKGVDMADILSHDMTAIDAFIKKKFEDADIPLLQKGHGYQVKVNPPDDYIIEPQDEAYVLGKRID
jgi:voltage-gated potassium channel